MAAVSHVELYHYLDDAVDQMGLQDVVQELTNICQKRAAGACNAGLSLRCVSSWQNSEQTLKEIVDSLC